VVEAAAVETLPGTLELARRGLVPGGTRRNLAFVRPRLDPGGLTEPEQLVLADAQTSGGLLIAATDADRLTSALVGRGVPAMRIGRTEQGEPGSIRVGSRFEE
jgi:selenide,water dikinase